MKLREIAEKLNLVNLTPELGITDKLEVTRAHASDLLSDVLANAPRGGVLVTIQVHMNVIAVSLHAEQAGVIFASGRLPDETVRKKAVEEKIPLYSCASSTFDVAGRLYELGLRGAAARRGNS